MLEVVGWMVTSVETCEETAKMLLFVLLLDCISMLALCPFNQPPKSTSERWQAKRFSEKSHRKEHANAIVIFSVLLFIFFLLNCKNNVFTRQVASVNYLRLSKVGLTNKLEDY